MFQTKEQDKTPEEQSEVKTGNLTKKDLVQNNNDKDDQRTQEKGRTEWEIRSFKQRIRIYKEQPNRIKNTITEIKNTLEGMSSRLTEAEG